MVTVFPTASPFGKSRFQHRHRWGQRFPLLLSFSVKYLPSFRSSVLIRLYWWDTQSTSAFSIELLPDLIVWLPIGSNMGECFSSFSLPLHFSHFFDCRYGLFIYFHQGYSSPPSSGPMAILYINHIIPERSDIGTNFCFQCINSCKNGNDAKNSNGNSKQGKNGPQQVYP